MFRHMRKYERELIERCLDVLQEAPSTPGDARSVGLRLALWCLRPYCERNLLERFWNFSPAQNPMWDRGERQRAYDAVRAACITDQARS